MVWSELEGRAAIVQDGSASIGNGVTLGNTRGTSFYPTKLFQVFFPNDRPLGISIPSVFGSFSSILDTQEINDFW